MKRRKENGERTMAESTGDSFRISFIVRTPDPKKEPLTQNVRAEGGGTEKFAKTVNLPLTRKKTPDPNIRGEQQTPDPGGANTEKPLTQSILREGNKSSEHRLNLSRSWHKGHSHAYNTLFHLSRIQRICLSRYLNLFIGIAFRSLVENASAVTMLWSWATPKSCLCFLIITSGKAPIAAFQPGFWLRGVQP